jgi:hypothetical protein
MIENIPTPLVSFAGSGVPGFFIGIFLRVLKFLVIIMGSFLGTVFFHGMYTKGIVSIT